MKLIYLFLILKKNYMKRIVFLLIAFVFCASSCNSSNKKEQELALKEKELLLREQAINNIKKDTVVIKDTTNNKISNENSKVNSTENLNLPFVGIKNFETRHGVSGTGTPQKHIEIKENGDVFFGFEQYNQAYEASEREKHATKEKYYAGKYQTILKCVFKKWDNEVSYYKVTKDKIYQVKPNGDLLRSEDCCTYSNIDLGSKCPCIGDFYVN